MTTDSALTTVETQTDIESQPIRRETVLGVGFHCLSMSEAIRSMEAMIAARKPHQICLVNAYTVALAQEDLELRSLLEKASLVLADGMSIVWGSRWIDLRIPGRLAGPDVMTKLCTLAAEKKYRIFLLGSTSANLYSLEQSLLKQWPELIVAGTYSPSFSDRHTETENHRMVEAVSLAKTDILFVSMSAPKQEKWIAKNLFRLQAPVCVGVGAAFDFLSGRIPRAPQFFQTYGLEWLYRLWCEPRRLWKRYLLGNAVFLSHLTRQYLRLKFRHSSSNPH
jgi:N-acetylglucosaminyldiphosphoundecaprenol N-acetyl-beta-D-mannosaminyltransferase